MIMGILVSVWNRICATVCVLSFFSKLCTNQGVYYMEWILLVCFACYMLCTVNNDMHVSLGRHMTYLVTCYATADTANACQGHNNTALLWSYCLEMVYFL